MKGESDGNLTLRYQHFDSSAQLFALSPSEGFPPSVGFPSVSVISPFLGVLTPSHSHFVPPPPALPLALSLGRARSFARALQGSDPVGIVLSTVFLPEYGRFPPVCTYYFLFR